jgi:hypothetical protein
MDATSSKINSYIGEHFHVSTFKSIEERKIFLQIFKKIILLICKESLLPFFPLGFPLVEWNGDG